LTNQRRAKRGSTLAQYNKLNGKRYLKQKLAELTEEEMGRLLTM